MTDEITLDAPETRLERFLAAAAGVDGITLDEPETRIERYLYKIAQGGGGSGGGVLVVTVTDGTLDKTWQEIHDAVFSVLVSTTGESNKSWGVIASCDYISVAEKYAVVYSTADGPSIFDCDSASGYPAYQVG